VDPYRAWMRLDVLDCWKERAAFHFLLATNVAEHCTPNTLFCLFLAKLLREPWAYIWGDIWRSGDHNSQEQEDMARVQALLPKFREVLTKGLV